MNLTSPTRRPALTLVLLMGLLGGACVSHQHTIGLGATGTDEASARQFYVLFGLLPVNEVDPQRMAVGLTSYAIETKFGFLDMLIAPLLLPLTLTTRTVVVRT